LDDLTGKISQKTVVCVETDPGEGNEISAAFHPAGSVAPRLKGGIAHLGHRTEHEPASGFHHPVFIASSLVPQQKFLAAVYTFSRRGRMSSLLHI
jgi:hypothetical protein